MLGSNIFGITLVGCEPLSEHSLGGMRDGNPAIIVCLRCVQQSDAGGAVTDVSPLASVLLVTQHIQDRLGAAADLVAFELLDNGHDAEHGLPHGGAAVNDLTAKVQDDEIEAALLNPIQGVNEVPEAAPQAVVAGDHQHVATLSLASNDGAGRALQKLLLAAYGSVGTPRVGSVCGPTSVRVCGSDNRCLAFQCEGLFVGGSAAVPKHLHDIFLGVA